MAKRRVVRNCGFISNSETFLKIARLTRQGVDSGDSLRRLFASLAIEAILAGVVSPLAMAIKTYLPTVLRFLAVGALTTHRNSHPKPKSLFDFEHSLRNHQGDLI